MENKINYQFKLLSAIAMISVVAGHCGNAGIGGFFTWFAPYSFHLPLFIFISGYFFNDISLKDYSGYVKKKILRLILPYIIYNILYGVFVNMISIKGFTFGYSLSFESLIYLPLVSGHQFGLNCPSWFVIPLFMTYLIYPIFKQIFSKLKHSNILLNILMVLLFVISNHYSFQNLFTYDLRIFICRVMLFLPFFHFGNIFKTSFEKKMNHISLSTLFFVSIFTQLVLLWLSHNSLAYSMCWLSTFDVKNSIIVLMGSLNTILFLYIITKKLVIILPRRWYMPIANNTYDIMMNHLAGFFVLNTLFAILSKFIPISFDWIAYKSQVYYLRDSIYQLRVLYLCFGIGISMIIVYLKDKILEKMNYFNMLRKNT